jgi:hypothetical protein
VGQSEAGHAVTVAEDGVQGLAIARETASTW